MMTEFDPIREKILWQILDEVRGKVDSRDFLRLVRRFRECSVELTISELMYLYERTTDGSGTIAVPQLVAQFFQFLLEGRNLSILLDPFGGFGLLGTWLAHNLPDRHIDIVTTLADAQELIQPLKNANLTVHIGTTKNVTETVTDEYDAIVSIPPINRSKERRSYEVAGTQVNLNDDPSLLAIADLASHLGPNGFFAFVVAPRFAWEKRPDSIRKNLDRFGLHLSALLKFRPGTFAGISLALDLAIIDRKVRETLFVAEIPEDAEAQKALVARLLKRKQGPTPSQGRLVPQDQFHGLAALEAKERYYKLARVKGLDSVLFSIAVPQIQIPKRRDHNFEHCGDHPHAVYLPDMAATDATTHQDDLPPRLKSYLQLIVNPEVVLPEYLAGLLNTPMGHAFRHMVMTGETIPRINRPLLLESKLYLPSIREQGLGLEAAREIQRLRNELTELESNIWQRPNDVSRVVQAIHKVNHEERFSDWLETLPFPLAAILRSYHALDLTPKDKYERLLHFFEAFTEFCAAIHLSATRVNAYYWEMQREQITKVLDHQHLSLHKASFGSWRVITELMAGRLRSMLHNKEERIIVCDLYTTADAAPLKMLASAELAILLQRINGFRNRWKGHGGAITEAEACERFKFLEADLAKFREIVGNKFLQYQLIEPRESEILDGPVFRCRIRRVMGSNPQLEHDTVDLTMPAKTGCLYLHNPGHVKALELLPLVQVRSTPQPASYFYNRLEKTEPQLVSYHFAAQSEISSSNATLLKLLKEFVASDKDAKETEE